MELNVQERLGLFLVLPQKGSFNTLRMLRELREHLELTPDEKKRFGFVEEDGRASWKNDAEVEIPVPVEMKELAKQTLTGLDKKSELPSTCVTLYEKFVLNTE